MRTLGPILVLVVFGSGLLGCGADPDQSDYVIKDASPGGTGKLYMGREIALPRTDEDEQAWYDRPSREAEELSDRLLDALQLTAADHVADVGAGMGFYALRLAARVPSGRVLALDVDRAMLDTVVARSASAGITNIFPRLGTVTDPGLEPESIDLALIVASYHEFSHPREMLEGLFAAIKPGGRLAIVEYRGEDDTLPMPPLHRMSEAQIRQEVERVGFQWRTTRRELAQQHLVLFVRPADSRP